ncbi:hypothetical protein Baya_1495 [Bagarius yarrelli]|uniref:Uncharacterized protein n=1 Tax=Bagarius yarrelli TaxID=175774 RepID=A0A556TL95_BAGYA|nr:hypothetical protein Baya_1495 [Bagarius yarrelli]
MLEQVALWQVCCNGVINKGTYTPFLPAVMLCHAAVMPCQAPGRGKLFIDVFECLRDSVLHLTAPERGLLRFLWKHGEKQECCEIRCKPVTECSVTLMMAEEGEDTSWKQDTHGLEFNQFVHSKEVKGTVT